MKIVFSILILMLFTILNIYGQKKATEITFCQFPLSQNLKEGNVSFTLRYRFKVGEGGKPVQLVDLSKLPASYVSKEQAEKCISNWRFPDLTPDLSLVAFFRWEHGKGWTKLSIIGKEVNQTIELSGERCPYSNGEIGSANIEIETIGLSKIVEHKKSNKEVF
ncbi:MAG TPA: hypothetical protein VIL74_03720 [Pyrinomonadaceae bacterium]|jgi:hypothetical protein